ncbi:MAG: N-acetylmuramoyl-L-alanine amidase [Brevinematales bacterium]|jgi:N-acetylmuramoyl-L-alanine amidase
MEFKKLIICGLFALYTAFLPLQHLTADTPLSALCSRLKIGAKYNINYGFVDLSGSDRSVRIYLALPYIVAGGSIYYMNTVPSIDRKGEIELSQDYEDKITELFNSTNKSVHSPSSSYASHPVQSSSAQTSEKGDQAVKTNYNVYSGGNGFSPIDMVLIDPGHGGKDPGGIGSEGIKEKEVVLSVARMTGLLLKSNLNIPVEFTRKGDIYVSLKDRTQSATAFLKRGKNPIFVSIHGNISFNNNVRGLEVYSLSDRATDNEALAVETVENAGYSKTDIDRTENLNFIISDLLKDTIRRQSEDLSGEIGRFISKSGLTEFRGNKKANFYVLKYSYMPSVLVEIGYLSNPAEARNLNNRDYQKKIAKEIAMGINSYIVKYNKMRGQ